MKKFLTLVVAICFICMCATEALAARAEFTQQPETATTSKSGEVSFSVKIRGDYKALTWYFVNPATGKKISGKKLQKTKSLKGIKVSGTNRPNIILKHVPEAMHGWLVYCVINSGGQKIDSEYATLLVYGMDPPESSEVDELEITKQPVDTAISSKNKLTFTVEYNGLAEKLTWAFINPKTGEKVISKNIKKKFKNIKVTGLNKAKMTISNVPESMVGWGVYVHFKGKGIEFDSDVVHILAPKSKSESTE